MFLDSATLHDLEIVPAPATHGPTLWEFVDRTRTRIGRKRLRQRLLSPAHSADQILALQKAHRALAAESGAYRTVLDGADSDGAWTYLSVNWQLPAEMRLVWRGKWYRQYLEDVANGQTRITALLGAAAELRDRLSGTDAAELAEIAKRIAAVIDEPEAHELLRLAAVSSSSARRAFDQVARGSAKRLLTDLLDCIGTVEAMWSLAVATLEHGWSYPQPSSALRATGIFHPFLGQKAVGNDICLDDTVRVCFVTGPNMAGKSTFLKAVAIAVLLAHAGCGVPAASMEFPVVGTIFSSIHVIDSLSSGESFYLAEVRRIRALALALSDHHSAFAVIDEPFRGTNVHDAAEATLAVISRLAAHSSALVFVASHVGEVIPAIADDSRVALFHFSADLTDDRPRFDYRLQKGVSTQRLGMILLRQEHVLDLLESSTDASGVLPETTLRPGPSS